MGIFFTLMMMTLTNDYWPQQLVLKNTRIDCSDIVAMNLKDGYSYVGIRTPSQDYMTSYTDSDKLQAEINKQCKVKNEKSK